MLSAHLQTGQSHALKHNKIYITLNPLLTAKPLFWDLPDTIASPKGCVEGLL